MKKGIILIFACSFLAVAGAYAQLSLSFGAKAGVNMSKITTTSTKVTSDNFLGPVGGFYLRAKVLGFFLQGEAVVSMRGGEAQIPATFTAPAITTKLRSTNLDVPVLFGKKFFKVIRVNAGPNFQFLLGNKKNSFYDYNSFVLGYQAGIGIDVLKFGLDVRYDGNLSKVNNAITTLGSPVTGSTRTGGFQITLAYKLKGIGI